MDVLKVLFLLSLFSSINAGIVALLIIAVRSALKNKIAPRVLCLLWLLVIVKLITAPITSQSQIGVFHTFKYQKLSAEVSDAFTGYQSSSGYRVNENTGVNDLAEKEADKLTQIKRAALNEQQAGALENSVNTAQEQELPSIYALVWAAGTVLLMCVFAYSGIRFSRNLRNAEKLPADVLPEPIQVYLRNNSCHIGFYVSPNILSPCMTGVITSKIYIPQSVYDQPDKQQLAHMLMHEIAHAKRKDNLLNVLVAALNAIHWFNPVLWYAMKLYSLDREMSCDALALETLGQEETIPYGLTLLNHAKCIPANHYQFHYASFYKSKNQIGRRIIMIKNFKKGSYKITAAALTLCLLIGLATLVNAAGIKLQSASAKESDQLAHDDPIRAALGNSNYMYFNSLKQAQRFCDFPFKAPEYLPEGYKFFCCYLYRDYIDTDEGLVITYCSSQGSAEEQHLSLSVSKGNLLQHIKMNKDAQYEEEKINIRGLDAVLISVKTKQKSNPMYDITDTVKDLVWKDQETWFDLQYSTLTEDQTGVINISDSIPEDELSKIFASMKTPESIKNSDYTSQVSENFHGIYDKAGLKEAEKMLGFTPLFPLELKQDFRMVSADLAENTYFETDQNTPRLAAKYASAEDNSSETIMITQRRLSSLYDSIVQTGQMSIYNSQTHKDELLAGKKSVISNVSVYAFALACDNELEYVWAQNGVYFTAVFSDSIDCSQDIVKTLITMKP